MNNGDHHKQSPLNQKCFLKEVLGTLKIRIRNPHQLSHHSY